MRLVRGPILTQNRYNKKLLTLWFIFFLSFDAFTIIGPSCLISITAGGCGLTSALKMKIIFKNWIEMVLIRFD